MKAFIEADPVHPDRLKLRIAGEGVNDRTLMGMLERQYPTIITHNNELEIPLEAWVDTDPFLHEMKVEAEEIKAPYDTVIRLTSGPWRGNILRNAVIKLDCPPGAWRIERVQVCGRQLMGDTFDLLPGMIVAIEARSTSPVAGKLAFRVTAKTD